MKYNDIGQYKYKDLERFTYAQLEAEEIAKRRNYVIVYDPFEDDFDHLGEAVINDCINDDVIVRELNGEYSFSCTVTKDKRGKYKRIKPLSVIKAQNQLFRIPLWSGIKDNGLTLSIKANHIFWDLMSAFTDDRRVKEQNIYEAASRILEADYTGRFRLGVTDVTTVANANFIEENAVQSIMKKLLPRWKAEMLLDNFKITFKSRLGKYKPDLYVRYGKNASSIKKTIDYTNVCTRIVPKGRNGIDIKEGNGGVKYLDSSKINKYPIMFPQKVKFEEAEDVAMLLEEAREYLKEHEDPLTNLEIELIDLLENGEYENLFNAINIELGDTVTAFDTELGVNEEIRCIREEIVARTGIKLKITLGKFIPSIADSMNDTEEEIDNINTKVDDVAVNEGNSSMEIEALKKNIESIGGEINNLEATDRATAVRLQKLEEKQEVLIDSMDVEIINPKQKVPLPSKFQGRGIKIASISILNADDITNVNIKDTDHSIENNTIDILSNLINIKIRLMIISV